MHDILEKNKENWKSKNLSVKELQGIEKDKCKDELRSEKLRIDHDIEELNQEIIKLKNREKEILIYEKASREKSNYKSLKIKKESAFKKIEDLDISSEDS